MTGEAVLRATKTQDRQHKSAAPAEIVKTMIESKNSEGKLSGVVMYNEASEESLEERQARQAQEKLVAAIKNSAIALLARREHSKHELIKKLSRKYSETDLIEREIDSLAKRDMQSDERFVESFIRAKKSHGKGPKLIKQELLRRGVSQYLTASYVYEDDDDWLALAENVYVKKFGDTDVEDMKEKGRRIRFMVSRGFSPDTAFKIIDRN